MSFITKLFGVLSILLSMIKLSVYTVTIGKIIVVVLKIIIMSQCLAQIGSQEVTLQNMMKAVQINLIATNVMDGKNQNTILETTEQSNVLKLPTTKNATKAPNVLTIIMSKKRGNILMTIISFFKNKLIKKCATKYFRRAIQVSSQK